MQFFKPEYFPLLWLVPVIAVLFFFSRKIWERRVKRLGDPVTIREKLIPEFRKGQWLSRAFLLSLVFLFATLALARPQWGEEKKKVQRKGIDVVFLLDTSLSMLAEDVRPNRLEKSKIEIKNFVRGLHGDRVGMVAFAGSSFLQAPLTLDYGAFFLFLDAVDTGYIPDPGTSLSRALMLAIKSFPPESLKHKALVVLTDGEDHEGGIEQAITALKEANVRVYAIGVGKEEGEPIPLKDERGNRTGYKKDRSGQVVLTRLNAAVLKQVAEGTDGIYLPSTAGEREVDLILQHMESLGERTFKERMISEKEDHFQLFLILAFVFLVLEMLVKKKKKLPPIAIVLLIFMVNCGFMQSAQSLNEDGNALFAEKKYQSALEKYRSAQVKEPEDPTILYNLGSTLYQMQQYQEARSMFEKAVENTEDPALKAKGLYNYGNTLYRLGDFEKAIDAYKQALKLNPDDEDSKYNIEFLQRSKNNFEKQNQDQQKDSNQKDQQKNQDQKQDQQEQQQKPNQQQDKQEQDQQKQQQDEGKGEKDQKEQKGDQDKKDQKNDEGKDSDGGGGKDDQNKEGQGEKDKDKQGKEPDKPDKNGEERPSKPDEQKAGDQPAQEGQEPGEKSKPDNQGDQEQPAGGGQEEKEQPAGGQQPDQQKQPAGAGQEQSDQPSGGGEKPSEQPQGGSGQGRQPLQGQMTKENAERILDALAEGEKQLQDLRRPQGNPQPRAVLKDW